MRIKVDAAQLEWRSYVELSRDKVALQELWENVDIHTRNQTAFGLPTRLISKVFLFRWIYRGSGWAYANDPDFQPVSSKPRFWDDVIEKANQKYWELYEFQEGVIRRASRGEEIVIPSGRGWFFERKMGKDGPYFDVKQITNYINQGFGADIVLVARKRLRDHILQHFDRELVLLDNTVHDDIQLDVDNDPDLCYNICMELENLFPQVPGDFKKWFKYEFVVPLKGEVWFGPDMATMSLFDKTKGREQFL